LGAIDPTMKKGSTNPSLSAFPVGVNSAISESMATVLPLRWGILSTARIIRSNWVSMRESGAATLVALASRDIGRAQEFIDELQATTPWLVKPAAYGSYESLLADPEVDAVYIPLPTGIRKEWVIRAAEAGKHVLCEKPCAINAADLREMTDCCARHGVMFMDGVMLMHDPRYVRLREIMDDGVTIGSVKRISSSFNFRGGDDFIGGDIRSHTALEPAGCLGDLGWYCLRGILWAMNWQLPQRVSGRVLATAGSAIMDFSGDLDFADGASATFHCSFLAHDQVWLSISGTQGSLRVADFVSPAAGNDSDWEIGYQRQPRLADTGMSNPARMFVNFAAAANKLDRQWAEISLVTQVLQDACELSSQLGRPLVLDGGAYRPDQ
jgi:predicted dehydrogenase